MLKQLKHLAAVLADILAELDALALIDAAALAEAADDIDDIAADADISDLIALAVLDILLDIAIIAD